MGAARSQGSPTRFRVLTICTGNICRSPLAEQILRARLASTGMADAVAVSSAGLAAVVGAPMEPLAADTSLALGGEPVGHAGTQVNADSVANADLILTMTLAQRDEVLRRYPSAAHRVFTLAEYQRLAALALEDGGPRPAWTPQELTAMASRRRPEARATSADDVEDPYRRPSSVYEAVSHKIDTAVTSIASAWGAASVPVGAPVFVGVASSERIRLRVIEVEVEIVCTGTSAAATRAAIAEAWAWCVSEPTGKPAGIVLEVWCQDGATRDALDAAWRRGAVAGTSVHEVMHFLSSVVTTSAITAQAGSFLMLHGCAVAMADGRVVAFVGPSGMGKTTVARTLAQHFGYVTDETVVIRFDGTVVAYPKPLSLVVGALRDAKDQVAPRAAGLLRAPDDLRLAAVVLLDRHETGPDFPVIVEVDLLEGLAELAAQVSFLARIERPLRTFASVIEGVGGMSRVTYREASTLIAAMPELLENAS